MNARTLVLLAGAGLAILAAPPAAGAQPDWKIARIGVLRSGSSPDPLVDAFRQGLRELGYVEGRDVVLEYRWADGRDERLAALAADLVRLGVDVIVAGGSQALVAKQGTSPVPIVMSVANDPVGSGVVATLARPGGHVTGLAFLSEELPGKWVELVREMMPRATRVAVLWHPPAEAGQLFVAESAARALDLRRHPLKVQRSDDFQTAFAEARRERAEALITLSAPLFYAHRARLVDLAARYRLPAVYHRREFVIDAGGLISYGPNLRELFRRAATYVDEILKGARPAARPIEQPTVFELAIINLKAARALGLTVAPSLLARADEVVQ